MEDITPLNQIPSRIKYYLLDWKDNNMDEYIRMFGDVKLRDLKIINLRILFIHATKNERF